MFKRKRLLLALFVCLLLPRICLSELREKIIFHASEHDFPAGIPTLDLYVCNLVRADAMYLTYSEHSMMVDLGPEGQADKLLEMLRKLNVTRIDYLLNTHPHADHLGGLPAVLDFAACGRFITGFPLNEEGNSVIQRSSIRLLQDRGIPISRLNGWETISFGEASITAIQSPRSSTVNDRSIMLRILLGERSLLLGGDVGPFTAGRLARLHNLKADVLKYPHHGLDPLQKDFLAGVDPAFAIITHDSVSTLQAQAQLGSKGIPYLLAPHGVIHFSTDGNVWVWRQWQH